jgi:hypothetical protein
VRKRWPGAGDSRGVRTAAAGLTYRAGETVATRLDKTIKRELELDGALYTVTISPEGVAIAPKGRRKGHFLPWQTLLSGDAELTRDLKISLDAFRGEGDDGG